MAMQDFERLIDGICKIRNIIRTPEHSIALHLRVDGVFFTLAPGAARGDVEGLIIFCDFGAPPESLRADALRQLMEANLYLFGPEAPRFGCHPETGNVLYMSYQPLEQLTHDAVLQMLGALAAQAQEWNESNRQASREPPPAASTHASLRTGVRSAIVRFGQQTNLPS